MFRVWYDTLCLCCWGESCLSEHVGHGEPRFTSLEMSLQTSKLVWTLAASWAASGAGPASASKMQMSAEEIKGLCWSPWLLGCGWEEIVLSCKWKAAEFSCSKDRALWGMGQAWSFSSPVSWVWRAVLSLEKHLKELESNTFCQSYFQEQYLYFSYKPDLHFLLFAFSDQFATGYVAAWCHQTLEYRFLCPSSFSPASFGGLHLAYLFLEEFSG